MKVARNFSRQASRWVHALLAPADDPRSTLASVFDRQQQLLDQVRAARASIAASRQRLESKIGDGRLRLAGWEQKVAGGASTSERFDRQLRRRAAEEVHALEAELRALTQEEALLPLVEARLTAEIDALRARQEVVEVRTNTAEAQSRVRDALGEIARDLSDLGTALAQAEDRTERMQARTSAIEQFTELDLPGDEAVGSGAVSARRLALRLSFEADESDMAAYQTQLAAAVDVLHELTQERARLTPVLLKRREEDPISVSYLPALAEETFRQGLQVLESALEVAEAASADGQDTAGGEGAPGGQVADLVGHARRCASALRDARGALADIHASTSADSADAVTELLTKTLRQATAVQQALTDAAGPPGPAAFVARKDHTP